MPPTSVVQVQNVAKHFGAIHAVDGITLSVHQGEIYGLLGPNGSGKTTLIRLILGLLPATSGEVRMFERVMPDKHALSQVGYMTQASALYEELTIHENINFFARIYGHYDPAWIGEILKLVDLTDRAASPVRTLSGGMRQRTSLACALAHRPQLLLLDEPTVGVDPQLRFSFWSYFRRLAESGVALVISSHVMDEAERCDRLGMLRAGKLLAEGSSAELRAATGAATLEEAFLCYTAGEAKAGAQ